MHAISVYEEERYDFLEEWKQLVILKSTDFNHAQY